jgi:hypothetical protein
MKPDYQPIYEHLRKLHYLKINSLARTWLTDSVVGFNVSASSLLRKNYTIERINQEINNYELPLLVDDEATPYTSSFRLMIKV